MTAPLADTVALTLTEDTVGISGAGFGTLVMLSYEAPFTGVRSYTSYAEVATDFGAGTPERLAAAAVFGQAQKPRSIKIYAASAVPTQRVELNATPKNSRAYQIPVQGPGITSTTASFTAGAAVESAATPKASIHVGLVGALNAVVGKNYTAAYAPLVVADLVFTRTSGNILSKVAHTLQTGDGPFQGTNSGGALPAGMNTLTDYWIIRLDADTFSIATSLANAIAGTAVPLSDAGTGTHTLSDTVTTARPSDAFTVTGNTAGDFFYLETDRSLVSLATTHADPGLENDLDALLIADQDWYALYLTPPSASTDVLIAAATWIEANGRLLFADTPNSLCASAALAGASVGNDVADRLLALSFKRSAVFYHPAMAGMPALRLAGLYLPRTPGAAIAKFKQLSGIVAANYTSTERAHLRSKRCNFVERAAGLTMLFDGYVSRAGGTGWLDVTRDIDYLQDQLQTRVFGALASADRVGYDDAGLALVQAEMLAGLADAQRKGIILPGYVVTVPLLANISDADKANRHLPDMKWAATLRGAVQTVDIVGVISL